VTELHIPAESFAALIAVTSSNWADDEQLRRAAQSIAAPVVAAELRSLADELNWTHAQPEMNAGLRLAIRKIRARADELDPS
jgi:hypothetical protein